MAVVTFWNNGKVETGQSMTIAALAANIAIEYDYKILMINTKYNDRSLERAFEPKNTVNSMFSKGKVDVDMGLSGITKAIMSNKTSPEIITNYTKIILKNLELLTDKKMSKEEFDRHIVYLKDIIKLAEKYFDIVIVDLEEPIKEQDVKQILELSKVKVITLAQNLNVIDDYIDEKEEELVLQGGNKIITLGKYDEKSKYTERNVAKYIREKNVFGIPYNSTFAMDAPEGNVADYMIRFKRVKPTHINANFIGAINKMTEEIISMIRDTQRKIY